MTSRRLMLEWWGLLFVILGGALLLGLGPPDQGTGALVRFDLGLLDVGKRLVAIEPADDLVLIEIDEISLGQVGRWPWPRKIHAALIDKLKAEGARTLGLDLLLSEPSPDDEVLAKSFASLPVQLPVTRSLEPNGTHWPAYPILTLGAKATIAHPHFRVDPDGNVRGLYLSEAGFPAFALGLLHQQTEAQSARVTAPQANGGAELADRAWRASTQTERNLSLVQKAWPSDYFTWLFPLNRSLVTYSYGAVLRDEFPKDAFRGKTILVGANAEGLGDHYSSSLLGDARLVVGMQLHAVAYTGLVRGRLIQKVSVATAVMSTVLGLSLLMALLYSTSPRLGLLVMIAFLALFLLVCLLMLRSGYWLPPAGILVMGLAAYPLWSWRRLEAALFNLRRQAQAMASQPAWLSGAPTETRSLEPIARSLSALDRSAERLMQVRHFLSSVLDNLPHPAFVADLGGSIRLANPTAYEAFADLPKARDEVQPSSTQDSANKWLREFFEGQAGMAELSREIVKTERQIEATDRLGREWLIEIKPLGEPWRLWLVQFVNITRIKALQREREQMLAFLTHDIRSPQVTILSALSQAGDLQTQPWAQTIELEARRGLGLAESYVQWARAEHKPLRLEDTDLGDLCTEVVDSFWIRAEAQGVTIALSAIESAWVQLDQTLVRRAIANLVENALRFSPSGGLIRCEVRLDGAFWIIEIADQGPGVPQAELEKIFEPYVRGAAVANSGADSIGAGLGLAFVRLVSTRHGGEVSVANLTPNGASFRISLPASI